MQFDIITIFPHLFDSFLNESLIQKSVQKKVNKICVHDLRQWAKDKRKTVDDRPYGGGPGMVLMAEPIINALKHLNTKTLKHRKKESGYKSKVILLSPAGKQFDQKVAEKFSQLDQLIFICGRYEGVDARVERIIDKKISIGPYILSGGELAAMVIIESVARLILGYLSNPKSLKEESRRQVQGRQSFSQYARPEVVEINGPVKSLDITSGSHRVSKKYRVPKVLLSGNHKKIKEWREKHSNN